MINISPISPRALEEAKVLASKALHTSAGATFFTSASILRIVRDANDMGQVWGVLTPPFQYRFIENINNLSPRTPSDAKPFKEITAWIRRYAVALQSSAWPAWDSEE